MDPKPANPLLDWPPIDDALAALDHVMMARSFLVRMQEAMDQDRLAGEGRAYTAAIQNLRIRIRRALELGATEKQVLSAAAHAYRSDLCHTCGRIYYSKTEDPRFSGMCGECLYSPHA